MEMQMSVWPSCKILDKSAFTTQGLFRRLLTTDCVHGKQMLFNSTGTMCDNEKKNKRKEKSHHNRVTMQPNAFWIEQNEQPQAVDNRIQKRRFKQILQKTSPSTNSNLFILKQITMKPSLTASEWKWAAISGGETKTRYCSAAPR